MATTYRIARAAEGKARYAAARAFAARAVAAGFDRTEIQPGPYVAVRCRVCGDDFQQTLVHEPGCTVDSASKCAE